MRSVRGEAATKHHRQHYRVAVGVFSVFIRTRRLTFGVRSFQALNAAAAVCVGFYVEIFAVVPNRATQSYFGFGTAAASPVK